MSDDEIPKIGDPIVGPYPAVFELILDDHVPWVNPVEYGLDRQGINPHNYFITSGDAIEKTKVMNSDFWQLAGELRKEMFELIAAERKCSILRAQELYRNGVRPSKPMQFAAYEADVWKAAGQCRKLLNALQRAKGDNIFLEVEWSDHRILCIPKNPRG